MEHIVFDVSFLTARVNASEIEHVSIYDALTRVDASCIFMNQS